MTFNSIVFLVFFALFLIAYYPLNLRWQNRLILVASYIFYGWWDWRFCSLLFASTFVDYLCAIAMSDHPKRRKVILWGSMVFNLGVLGFFKYANFFADNARLALQSVGIEVPNYALDVILPVGISFYTFQTMSYTIDVYRGRIPAARNFWDFAAYVAFWPQLVAGPILRATELMPQIQRRRVVPTSYFLEGTYLILVGMAKKVAVADVIASPLEQVVRHPQDYSSFQMVLASALIVLRVYCDISGYSDIARGCARYLGFRFRDNFLHPFFSTGINELWRRYHASLSGWFRDYVFIPLGGSRVGPWRLAFNVVLVMGLAGLWHGASWNYVLWGLAHGGLMATDRALSPFTTWVRQRFAGVGLDWVFRTVARCVVIALFTALAGLFYIRDTGLLIQFYGQFLDFTYKSDPALLTLVLYGVGLVGGLELWEWKSGARLHVARRSIPVQAAVFAALLVIIFLTWTQSHEPFIYFQF